ncbi:nucleotidyltransferase domain-containing protein [Nocardioides marmoriginsengisoli]|uniref:Nucleotidyltransferase domain-containing protein n=1 Tax=Nocardioides marmoriginsengisoli TaxID=661483 RepID=A0A3N0CBC9_9ACTN|nr:nucleotidyltransferase domain-containing protein [Nocardioides marmoriginsengisoli]RNL60757.1 nucleotidyltransferase domain-containing protein [Nocardioides marmoriginsengisoli]
MDWNDPTTAAVSSLDGAVLAVLAQTNRGLTGRDVHRQSRRGTAPSINKALNRLVDQGVVFSEATGNAYVYLLNRDHIAAGIAVALAGLRGEFFNRLRSQLSAWSVPAVGAAVFGSVARGDATTESDIDLLIVRPNDLAENDVEWTSQIDRLRDSVTRWTGNDASMLQVTERDLRGVVDRDAPIRESLMNDAIDLLDQPIRELLGRRTPG